MVSGVEGCRLVDRVGDLMEAEYILVAIKASTLTLDSGTSKVLSAILVSDVKGSANHTLFGMDHLSDKRNGNLGPGMNRGGVGGSEKGCIGGVGVHVLDKVLNFMVTGGFIGKQSSLVQHTRQRMLDWFWRAYAKRLHTRWEKTFLWDMIEPYQWPKSLVPLVSLNIAAFYTGVVGAAITEQLYKLVSWFPNIEHDNSWAQKEDFLNVAAGFRK
eukprot:Gb_21987 [translate_table: standard]